MVKWWLSHFKWNVPDNYTYVFVQRKMLQHLSNVGFSFDDIDSFCFQVWLLEQELKNEEA